MAKRVPVLDSDLSGESPSVVVGSSELIFEVIEDPECGYRASALGASIHTYADTLDKLRANIREAVACYFDDDEPKPKILRLHFVRDEVLVW